MASGHAQGLGHRREASDGFTPTHPHTGQARNVFDQQVSLRHFGKRTELHGKIQNSQGFM